MGLKDTIQHVVGDAKDAVKETVHRGAAETEREKRAVAGEEMTPGEHLSSFANEVKNEGQAEISHGKRDLRDTL